MRKQLPKISKQDNEEIENMPLKPKKKSILVEPQVMLCCKTCAYWKSKQSELEYDDHTGICTCYKWKFTTTNDADIMLLDRDNRSAKYKGVHRFENQLNQVPFGQVERSRYCFVTDEKFGCIHHSKA